MFPSPISFDLDTPRAIHGSFLGRLGIIITDGLDGPGDDLGDGPEGFITPGPTSSPSPRARRCCRPVTGDMGCFGATVSGNFGIDGGLGIDGGVGGFAVSLE